MSNAPGMATGGVPHRPSRGVATPVHKVAGRSAVLDGVRGIAVLLVLLSHTSGRDQALTTELNFHGIGHVGVYLFFVLSAFLLGLGLMREGIDAGSIRGFFVRRVFRIIPLYYAVLLAVFAVQLHTGSVQQRYLHIADGWSGFTSHLAMYRGDGVFWSVVIEMQFYLVVPLITWALIKWRGKAVLTLVLISVVNELLYASKYLLPDFQSPIGYLSPNYRGDGTFMGLFVSGILAAYVVHFQSGTVARYEKWLHWFAFFTFTALMVLTLAFVSKNFLGLDRPFYGLRYLTPLYGAVFALFLLSVHLGNPLTRWLQTDLLRVWGVLGFSVYLLHMLVISLVNQTGLPASSKLVLTILAVLTFSAVTYQFIERPAIVLSYRLTGRTRSGTK